MSDIPTPNFDLEEQISRIRQGLAQTSKFQAETDKLLEEARKLTAEGRKFNRERLLAPWLLITSLVTALTGGVVVAVIGHFWR